MRHPARAAAMAMLVAGGMAQAAPVTVVEYYDAALDHYFMSPLAADIQALDSGRFQGWARTGHDFVAFGAPTDVAGASPVCRWYIPPQHGDSHFFSASPVECDTVAARAASDPDYSGYKLETASAFHAALPDPLSGACPAGLLPLYRLWNQRADSNHRYTTDAAIRDAMIAHGYAPEGYGPRGVAMCVAAAEPGDAIVQVSSTSPYATGCDATASSGTAYVGAEVEPMLAVNPTDPHNVIATWQQDRWSNGGARGVRTAYSHDGGRTWQFSQAAFSRCSGGNVANGGDYARASDPWVSMGPSGIAYQIAIAFNGGTFAPGSSGAVLVSRSLDGGATWSPPATLIRDGAAAFNDKESIAADPHDASFAYAVWDRLLPGGSGPSWFSRTADGGATWEPARPIYTPPNNAQTLNNQVVVLPDGTLVLFFTQIGTVNGVASSTLGVARSPDRGTTWSAPVFVAASLSVGTRDPETNIPLRDGANIGSIAVGRNGTLAVAWQDGRFSGGTTEGIAFSRSLDGGVTWSVPVQVNRVHSAQALLPAVAIRDDGTFGVQYYDLRNDTADPATLPADTWLAESTNGVDWQETHLAGPFDFRRAPLVQEDGQGLSPFIGDYQALRASGNTFLPLFTQTTGIAGDVTDVFAGIVERPVIGVASYKAGTAMRGAGTAPGLRAAAARAAAATVARRRIGPALSASRP